MISGLWRTIDSCKWLCNDQWITNLHWHVGYLKRLVYGWFMVEVLTHGDESWTMIDCWMVGPNLTESLVMRSRPRKNWIYIIVEVNSQEKTSTWELWCSRNSGLLQHHFVVSCCVSFYQKPSSTIFEGEPTQYSVGKILHLNNTILSTSELNCTGKPGHRIHRLSRHRNLLGIML